MKMYHATSEIAARAILADGFQQDRKVWADSDDGFVFLGSSPRAIEMYGYHAQSRKGQGGRPVVLVVKVRKRDILPDDGKDWAQYCRSYKADVIRTFGKEAVKQPTATVTLYHIGQAKAAIDRVVPLAVLP